MRWHHQLRWKLFASHLVIVVIADVVLLATATFLASIGLVNSAPLTLGSAAAETGSLNLGVISQAPPLQQFQAVVQQALLVSGFAALAAAVVVSLFVSRRIVEPLLTLTGVSKRLAQGFYRERTRIVTSDDEIAQLSQSVNQLADALDQTEQRRLALLADVTHELRTPLATIGGYMEGLLDGVVKPSPETFSLILHESSRLPRLIEALELLSRVEAGQLPVVARSTDIRRLIDAMRVQFETLFAANQVCLHIETPARLPLVWADPDRIDQVLINLLSNAYRYTPAGGEVVLRVSSTSDMVTITVSDSGVGIAEEHLPHIFERFYRVDKSRARQSGGSGIGLAIVRHLVYAQGGDISVFSAGKGQGTTFTFTLPLAPLGPGAIQIPAEDPAPAET
ncbi:MAG: ATP-binding protein [Chloroflexales bacterium]